MIYGKYIITFNLFLILQIKQIYSYQLKLTLENQVYQFPINFHLYDKINKLPNLYLYEYERPNEKLSLPVLTINIGFPFQNFSLIYSTGKLLTWVYRDKSNYDKLSQKYFDTKLSKTLNLSNEEVYEINTFTFGSLCGKAQDYISINNNETLSIYMSFMLIFYLWPNSLFADGEFGMARKYLDIDSFPYINENVSNYSIIDGLFHNNIIKKKIFAHKWNSKKEGTLYIGEYPLSKEEIPHYDFHSCKPYNGKGEVNQFWNCYIDGIKIGNKYIDYSINNNINKTQEIGMFSTSEKFIFIPEDHIDIINFIKYYSKWGKENCILENMTSFKELHCNYRNFKFDYFPSIYLNFNGYEIELNPKDIFYYNDNNEFYRLLVVLYNKKNYWIFGSLLTNKKNMIFDNDNNGIVTFFEKKKTFRNMVFTNNLLSILFFCTLIGLIYLAKINFIKRKIIKEKNNESNEEELESMT